MLIYIKKIYSLLVFLFCSLSIIIDGGYSFVPAILFLISILFFWKKGDYKLEADDLIFIFSLIFYFSVGLLDTLWHDQDISNLDIFSRFLAAAFVLFYLVRRKVEAEALWLGFALGGILVGFWAIYQKFYIGVHRVDTAELNAIHFGNLSMLVGVFCLAGIFWANAHPKKRYYVPLLIVASFMAISASILSGTRSGWVGFPFVMFALYKIYSAYFPKNIIRVFSSVFALSIILLVAIPQTGVQSRLLAIESDIERYMDGYTSTSVGLRFEMWRSGWYAFVDKPILGWGEEAFYNVQPKLVDEYGLDKKILNFNHLHNQYVEELAKRGVLGLAAFLIVLLLPFKLFYSRLSSDDQGIKALSAAGMLGVICMIDFCLTQAMMRINSGVMFYLFSLVFIWVSLRYRENSLNNSF